MSTLPTQHISLSVEPPSTPGWLFRLVVGLALCGVAVGGLVAPEALASLDSPRLSRRLLVWLWTSGPGVTLATGLAGLGLAWSGARDLARRRLPVSSEG